MGWKAQARGLGTHTVPAQPPWGAGVLALRSKMSYPGLALTWSPQSPKCYKEVKGALQTASHP